VRRGLTIWENPAARSNPRGGIIMGGYGSGRWGGREGKPERPRGELHWTRHQRLGPRRGRRSGRGSWPELAVVGLARRRSRARHREGQASAYVGFHVRTRRDSGTIKLRYTASVIQTGGGRGAELMSYEVDLVTSGLPAGGLRWCRIPDLPSPCIPLVSRAEPPSGDTRKPARRKSWAFTS
jgi:hypothetical protein